MGEHPDMQAAVDRLRSGNSGLPEGLAEAIAGVIRGEIMLWAEMDGFVTLVDALIQQQNGSKSIISIGKRPDGSLAMHADNSDCVVRLAQAVLAEPEATR